MIPAPKQSKTGILFVGLILFEELESKFNVKFTLNELLNVKKIKDIKNILSVRGASLNE